MNNRTRDLVNMVKDAGLEVVEHYRKHSSVCVDARAPNGVERSFHLLEKSSSMRADLDVQGRIRRFARENSAPGADTIVETTLPPPAPEPRAPAVQPKPQQKRILRIMKEKSTQTNATTAAEQELTMAEFYRLCEWTKKTVGPNVPSLEALALLATSFIGHTVSEKAVREAMNATETPEPECWSPPKEPHVIVALELEKFMRSLGAEPSEALLNLLRPATHG